MAFIKQCPSSPASELGFAIAGNCFVLAIVSRATMLPFRGKGLRFTSCFCFARDRVLLTWVLLLA